MTEHDAVRSYRPGDWFGIVGERAVVILPPSEKSRVAALWELVDDGAGFDVTLDALISTGLRELSSFVLVSTAEGETKVVIRGPARAVFTVEGEEVELEGSSATTWVERSLHGVQRMSIVVAEEPSGGPAYVVDGGLFRISALHEAPAHEAAAEYERGPAAAYPPVPHLRVVDQAGDAPSADELEIAHTEAGGEVDAQTDTDDQESAGDLEAILAGAGDTQDEAINDEAAAEEPGPPPWAAARSPEPPSWTPTPPVPVPPPPPGPPAAAGAGAGWAGGPVTEQMPAGDDVDHDGLTRTGTWQPEPPQPPGIPGQPPAPDVTRPVARLVISNGETVEVDRAIVIGRAPEARRFSATEQPRLVSVPSPHLEISATHVEVRPGTGADHGSAVVTDLGSTNGTVLVQPGLGPEDLQPGVAVQLIPGAVIDLGDGVTIHVTNP